ncbi:MAG: hypothetical protein PVH03_05035 [Chloroflexota bacterium]
MSSKPSMGRLFFDSPAKYRVRVLGWLNPSWSDRLEGMVISLDTADEEQPICTLEGELLDQAALVGLLISLYELHLPVLSVKCLDASK